MKGRIRILFNTWANAENLNSQSLTARELARRLNPARFESSFFLGARQSVDQCLARNSTVRFIRVPSRLGTILIAHELMWGKHDVLFYPTLNERASRIFWRLRRLGRPTLIVNNIEGSYAQFRSASRDVQDLVGRAIVEADQNFAITPAIAREFGDMFQVKITVIPLGVDLELFTPMDRTRHGLPIRVLNVATIQARKQTHFLVEMARQLRDVSVEFHIVGPVIGDPRYGEQLKRQTEQEGLNVLWHGGLPQSEIAKLMHTCDVFVLPSQLEGFGKVTIEAGATGLPAVIFQDYSSTAVLDGETGYQVPTLQAMIDKVSGLCEDRATRERLGRNAVEYTRQFGWDVVARQWETSFEGMM